MRRPLFSGANTARAFSKEVIHFDFSQSRAYWEQLILSILRTIDSYWFFISSDKLKFCEFCVRFLWRVQRQERGRVCLVSPVAAKGSAGRDLARARAWRDACGGDSCDWFDELHGFATDFTWQERQERQRLGRFGSKIFHVVRKLRDIEAEECLNEGWLTSQPPDFDCWKSRIQLPAPSSSSNGRASAENWQRPSRSSRLENEKKGNDKKHPFSVFRFPWFFSECFECFEICDAVRCHLFASRSRCWLWSWLSSYWETDG